MTEPHLVAVDVCQVCGSRHSERKFEDPPFDVRRCTNCGLVYVTPRMTAEDLEREVYSEVYWKSDKPREHGYADYAKDEALYLKTFRRRLRFVQSHCPEPGRVLDVGCAAGYFLRVMRDAGWEVRGVELSPIAAEARRSLGDDAVFNGYLDAIPAEREDFAKHSFDLITMWDVIEHVPDPQELLRQVRQLLKPGGTLILETQNVDSAFANLLGRRWHHYKHREHLYHFNRSTVREVLGQAGFAVQSTTASYGGKYVSFSFIAERAARLHKAVSVLLSPLSLLKQANVYVNLRDELVVVAKPDLHRDETLVDVAPIDRTTAVGEPG